MNWYEELGKIQLQLEGLQAQANQLLQKKQEIIAEIIKEKNKPKVEVTPKEK